MKIFLTEQETCPRCGAKFVCGKSGKCWCYNITVPLSILEIIEDKFDACLCPDCLKELSASISE